MCLHRSFSMHFAEGVFASPSSAPAPFGFALIVAEPFFCVFCFCGFTSCCFYYMCVFIFLMSEAFSSVLLGFWKEDPRESNPIGGMRIPPVVTGSFFSMAFWPDQ